MLAATVANSIRLVSVVVGTAGESPVAGPGFRLAAAAAGTFDGPGRS